MPNPATAAYETTMATMQESMMGGTRHPDSDVAFMLGMTLHHQGPMDMARIQLQYGAYAVFLARNGIGRQVYVEIRRAVVYFRSHGPKLHSADREEERVARRSVD